MTVFDLSAIPTLLKIMNVDFDIRRSIKTVFNMKRCHAGFEIKSQSPIEHE